MSPRRRKEPSQPTSEADLGEHQIRRMLHELQVYSEEITVQNEQLLRAQDELEHARDRYADLYDFAPIGYLTLTTSGIIEELNIAAASLLGKARTFLIGRPLVSLIVNEDREPLRRFLSAHSNADNLPSPIDIHVNLDGHRTLRLIARPAGHETTTIRNRLFAAMLDVTEERRLSIERSAALSREQARSIDLVKEIDERMAAEERVKALLQRIVTVQEEERRRIALNLHDHLGQQLTALRLTVSAVKDVVRSGQDAFEVARGLESLESIIEQLDRDVDVLAWDLRPAALDDSGLAAAFRSLLRQWSALHGVPAQFHVTGLEDLRLPTDTESQLYRILQEALNNISKHSGAKTVSVLFERRGDEAVLTIEDDGRGFSVETSSQSVGRHSGMGLIGIQERALLVSGRAQIESAPGKGTTVIIRVPLPLAATETP